jgi:transcription-repair coupling factor (superfamily II helicase)
MPIRFHHNANNFGNCLILHQMRGREKVATRKPVILSVPHVYATSMIAPALEQSSELGSGFNIAMKVRDWRFIGREQSGHQ